ncbi:hypothetical protein SLE2022_025670 [Rubroshorea leprosula]
MADSIEFKLKHSPTVIICLPLHLWRKKMNQWSLPTLMMVNQLLQIRKLTVPIGVFCLFLTILSIFISILAGVQHRANYKRDA